MGRGWKGARAIFCVDGGSGGGGDRAAEATAPSPTTIRRSSSTPRESSKGSCPICLESMKSGPGRALFTAECTHMFHFSCIASNVKHGNFICPVCRSRWRDVPWNHKDSSPMHRRSPSTALQSPEMDPVLRILNESIANAQRSRVRSSLPPLEIYNDDEECAASPSTSGDQQEHHALLEEHDRAPRISAFAESSSVAASESRDDFTILVNVRAPPAGTASSGVDRAPVDLITVVDVSGSMSGSKLALLKSAMEFVVSQLGVRDRLSVITFSSSAQRLFPLKRMNAAGKAAASRSIHLLAACGGTDISGGLKLAGRVLADRRWKNPVSGVMLLSDGQDTVNPIRGTLLSGWRSGGPPIHTFGFGSDHDATTMHAVAESSGGTFNFIRAESSVRDAFAQCIGGLLSVVAQGVRVIVECPAAASRVVKVEQGGFVSRIVEEGRSAVIELGDLYAEEERDLLLHLAVAPAAAESIATIQCEFRDSMRTMVTNPKILTIARPTVVDPGSNHTSVEVDRQRNRVAASAAIAAAGVMADNGDFSGAQAALVECRRRIGSSAAFLHGDGLAAALHGELGELVVRMENRRIYEESGRAYALSAHSSHFRQRATARPDGNSYVTPSMTEMLHLSQTFGETALPRRKGTTTTGTVATSTSSSTMPSNYRLMGRTRSKSSRKVNPDIS